ncbi:MAG TPA: O-antigen ligase family protein [Sphingomicrobium sp.]|nr:O-antigen ligase family protein [Sphingomicrobium sp.]
MVSRLREVVAPAYLFLCLILGGSAQGIWANMVLQLLGIGLVAWAALAPAEEPLLPAAKQLLIFALVAVAIVAVQLVPLPSSLWPHLAGRAPIADGYRILGVPVPALPLSLTPYGSLNSLLGLIPPLGLFCAIMRLKAYRTGWLGMALLAGTVAGILLGALQVASGNSLASPWYLYEQSNFGLATGFFANANHMAILLVITLPFLAAFLGSARGANKQRNSAIIAMVAGTTLVIVLGIILNGSLAGYGLALPVAVTSALLFLPQKRLLRLGALVLSALLLAGAIGAIATSTTRSGELRQEATTSVQSRQDMLVTTVRAIRDFLPWGSGLGSFRSVYQLYESRDQITPTYVIHAHDDYVEIALELGVAGILLMIAFLAWWARAVWRAWRDADAGLYARAASIATAAILVHSVVDFPLRTAAIDAAFAMCLALLIDRRAPVAREKSDLWPTRHVVLK